ncbi:hypothetical protein [Vibrio cholerae]|uniref:hypothetical protein n=1 Tax=Vibrio cholerae TaxID=666 RepID=UPI0022B01F07|nr:hypothetical protein [Vibrio cholerae]
MIIHKHASRQSSYDFFFVLIILMPFFSNYVFLGGVSVGDFFAFLVLPWVLYNIRMSRNRLFFILMVMFLCILNLLMAFNYITEYYKFYRLIFYYLTAFFILCIVNVDFERYLKIYTLFVFFFSISIITQWVLYFWRGYLIPLQLSIPYYEPDTLKIIDHTFRSGGWLKEPSYFAIFVIPAVFYFILNKNYKSLLLVSLAGGLSTSSLFVFVFILAFHLLPLSAIVFLYVFGIAFSILMLLFFNQQVMDSMLISRVVDIFENGGTLNDRLVPFFETFDKSWILFNFDAYDFLLSGSYWFSSISSLISGLGVISVIALAFNFLNMGFMFSIILMLLVFTTHFMSGVYSLFLLFSLLAIYKTKSFIILRGAYV